MGDLKDFCVPILLIKRDIHTWETTKNHSTTDDTFSEHSEKIWEKFVPNAELCNKQPHDLCDNPEADINEEALEDARTLNAANEIFNNIINATVGSPTRD